MKTKIDITSYEGGTSIKLMHLHAPVKRIHTNFRKEKIALTVTDIVTPKLYYGYTVKIDPEVRPLYLYIATRLPRDGGEFKQINVLLKE